MERKWLAEQLAAGRSIETIAREVGRDPSTVAYWVNKHGLTSQHAAKHAGRGGLSRETLEQLLAEGLTVRAMAERLRVSYTTVRHWLRKYDLMTLRGAKLASTKAARDAGVQDAVIDCPIHGPTRHIRRLDGGMRCLACRSAAVSDRRRRVKSILVAELGGGCAICGYDRSPAALHFHHVDPSSKRFAVSLRGLSLSLETVRAEAQRCVLLCARCHAEVESGETRLPLPDERTAQRGR
jgi:transposase